MSMNTVNQGTMPVVQPAEPVGDTWRAFGAGIFNSANIAREDWQRAEQSAMLSYERSEASAEKARQWQEKMSNTTYQRAVEDLKKAGLNPVLAYDHASGMSVPSVGSATPSGGNSNGYRGSSNESGEEFLKSLVSLVAGIYTNGATNATKLAVSKQLGKNKLDELSYKFLSK